VDEEVKAVLESRRVPPPENEFGVLPSQLFSKRDRVKKVNDEELKRLMDGGETTKIFKCEYEFGKSVKEENKEYLKALMMEQSDIDEEIVLCTKCQVMLKVNMPELRLANGSRGIILGFGPVTGYPIVQFLDGRYMEIATHAWEMEEGKEKIVKRQMPLQLGFAISFHKSQGSTLEYVIIDIGREVFEYGQTYVALSRVKSLDGLFIINHIDYTKIRANPRVLAYYRRFE
jgi:ATP-dependent DNA helicase PIF1